MQICLMCRTSRPRPKRSVYLYRKLSLSSYCHTAEETQKLVDKFKGAAKSLSLLSIKQASGNAAHALLYKDR